MFRYREEEEESKEVRKKKINNGCVCNIVTMRTHSDFLKKRHQHNSVARCCNREKSLFSDGNEKKP